MESFYWNVWLLLLLMHSYHVTNKTFLFIDFLSSGLKELASRIFLSFSFVCLNATSSLCLGVIYLMVGIIQMFVLGSYCFSLKLNTSSVEFGWCMLVLLIVNWITFSNMKLVNQTFNYHTGICRGLPTQSEQFKDL